MVEVWYLAWLITKRSGVQIPLPLQKEELVVFTVNLTVNQTLTKTRPTKFF